MNSQQIWTNLNMWVYGFITALIGGCVLLIRKVLTNERQIDLLKQQLEITNVYRKERDEKMEHQLTEIRSDIKALIRTTDKK